MPTLLALDEKAGARWSGIAAAAAYPLRYASVAAYADSPPDAERAEPSAMIDDEADTAGDGGMPLTTLGAGDGRDGDGTAGPMKPRGRGAMVPERCRTTRGCWRCRMRRTIGPN